MVVLTTIGLAGTLAYKTGKFGVKSLYNIGKGVYNMTRRRNNPKQKTKSRNPRNSRKSRKSY